MDRAWTLPPETSPLNSFPRAPSKDQLLFLVAFDYRSKQPASAAAFNGLSIIALN
jgi:hypothetical protein